MSSEPRDTRLEAEQVLYGLLSQATPERRLELGLALCDEALDLAQQAISRANPFASSEEQKLLFVEVTYGKDLAVRVRTYLTGRQP
jgi:hypothetical protein